MILARSTNRYGAVRERTKVWSTRCSSAVSSRNCSGCLISASFLILSLFAPFYFTMDLVIAPLSSTPFLSLPTGNGFLLSSFLFSAKPLHDFLFSTEQQTPEI